MTKEFEGKKLLVLGGFTLACEIVKHAQRMGAYVIVADYNEKVPANGLADKFVTISATDVDAIVDFCRKEGVDGVTTGFVDILQQPCYDICKQLGLPYYVTPKMLSVSTNKIDFKETCNQYGVPVPQTYVVGNQISEEVYRKINYPVFVKPLDSSGSRGAGVCYNKEELDKQFAEALSFSATQNAMIEDYITGRDFILNLIAQDGEFRVISMFDRYVCGDRGSAINYSNIGMAPSKALDFYLDAVNDKVVNMFKSLGFTDGLYFLQGYSNGNKITFFEMGCRLGGSYYNLENKCIQCDPIDMTVRYAFTGKMSNDFSAYKYDVAKYDKIALTVNYLLKGKEETIAKIRGIEEIKQMKSFVECEQRQFEGDHYKNERIVDRPVFSVYLVVDNMEEARKDITYMNSVFEVYNPEGKSLLTEKFDPYKL